MTKIITPNILAIEAANQGCSVAIQVGEEHLQKHYDGERKATEVILFLVKRVLSEFSLSVKDLSLIAYSKGPGSFTGVRTSTAVTQGLAFPHKIPVVGISTLQCLAQQVYETDNVRQVLPLLDARKQELYAGLFELSPEGIMQPRYEEGVYKPEAIQFEEAITKGCVGVGSGWGIFDERLPSSIRDSVQSVDAEIAPEAIGMLSLAEHAIRNNMCVSAEYALPIYHRDPIDQ